MITSLVLSLREGLEAALIIGIVLGALRRIGRLDLNRPVWAGVFSAFVISLLAALLLRAVDKELEGAAEKIFEGVTLLLAAGVLTWMIFWMRRQSGRMKSELEGKVNQAVNLNGAGAVYFLALISVLREGIELALYLTASSLTSSVLQTLLGTAIGLFTAFLLGYFLYNTTLHLNLRRFFQVTAVILILFAAGLVAHSVAEFNDAGIIPAIISPIWNLNPLLNDNSMVGVIFSTLFGYHGSPSLTEALSYSIYILVTLFVFVKPKRLQVG
jgi:high-affinity iron transporter